jgi:hypothetical protein
LALKKSPFPTGSVKAPIPTYSPCKTCLETAIYTIEGAGSFPKIYRKIIKKKSADRSGRHVAATAVVPAWRGTDRRRPDFRRGTMRSTDEGGQPASDDGSLDFANFF